MKHFLLAQIIRSASYLRVNSIAGSEWLKQFKCVYCVVCRQCLRVPEQQESSCISKEANTPSTSRLPELPVYLWTSPWRPQPRWTERYSTVCRRASRLKACGDCPGVVGNLLMCWLKVFAHSFFMVKYCSTQLFLPSVFFVFWGHVHHIVPAYGYKLTTHSEKRNKDRKDKKKKNDGVRLPRIPRIWRLRLVSSQLGRFWGATDQISNISDTTPHSEHRNKYRTEKKDGVTLVHMLVGYNRLLCSIRKAIGRIC